MNQVTFERPELLLLLLVVPPLLALQLIGWLTRRRALAVFGGRGSGLVSRSASLQAVKHGLALIAVAALAVGLAGPEIGVRERVVTQQGVDLAIALDVSQSMAARDAPPDRLRTARNAVESLGRQMAGSRVALVLFAGDGAVRYPPTSDPKVLAQVLDNSRVFRPKPGSSLRAGLLAAVEAFSSGDPSRDEPRRRRAVLVLSDGEDTAGSLPDSAALLERGIRVYAIGVGTPEGAQIPTYDNLGRPLGPLRRADGQPVVSKLDEDALRSIAQAGGGKYWHYLGDEAVPRELADELRTLDITEISKELVPDDRFQWLVGIAVLALLLEWLISDRRRMPAPRPVTRVETPHAGRAVPAAERAT